MTPLATLQNLKAERIAITKKLAPVNTLMAEKRSELAKLQSAIAAANGLLDTAIKTAAQVEGRALIGAATPAEVADAKKARAAAQMAHAATQTSASSVRVLEQELNGLQAAVHDDGVRLGAIATEEASAEERYLRSIVESLGVAYDDDCKTVGKSFAALLAAQQMLAAANLNPNLTGGSTAMLLLPSFNTPAAHSPVGVLLDYDRTRLQQPQQFQAIRDRIAGDGVHINGLT